MATIAIVPARAGSRGLPGKNMARIGGRTLVQRAVDVAREVPTIDEVVVTSNDPQVLEHAHQLGVTVVHRPEELAAADARTVDVVRHVLTGRPDADEVVVLQPTSPLRQPGDVVACQGARRSAPSATTISLLEHPIDWTFRLEVDQTLQPVSGWDAIPTSRQETTVTYRLNGAVYVATSDHLLAGGGLVGPGTVGVLMPPDRSIDIDGPLDLQLARLLAWDARVAGPGSYVVFGGGGHAASVIDVLSTTGSTVRAVVDPSGRWVGPEPLIKRDEDGIALAQRDSAGAVVAIGDTDLRLRILEAVEGAGLVATLVVAPSASLSDSARLDRGVVVMQGAHVGPGAIVGAGSIVNSGAIVEHHVEIGTGTHVAPGATITGTVSIGDRVLIGAGATVLPGVRVGDAAVIGAGAVVVADVPAGTTVTGNPARARV